MSVRINGNDLTFDRLYEVVFGGAEVALDPAARTRMEASRAVIERLIASNETAYGVNTGFGELAEVRISPQTRSAGCSSTWCAATPAASALNSPRPKRAP